MYKIRILDSAKKELAKLSKPIAQKVVKRIRWLGENLEHINPTPLKGQMSDFYKLRTGDYRVLYEILHDEKEVVIHLIGHRKNIYRKRKRN